MRRFMSWVLMLGLLITPLIGVADDNSDKGSAPTAAELQEMKALLKAQSDALEQQRAALQRAEEKIRQLEQRMAATATPTPKLETVAATSAAPVPAAMVEPKKAAVDEPAPLYFKIGGAKFTPGGFLDFITFFRSTNVGSGVATTFNNIPFSNTVQGQSTELRMGAQTSRLALKVDSNVGENKVLGYVETDFVGNPPASMYVTSNSMTLRMRMFLADVRRGKWELMGGQAWTLMTPSRRGLAILPSDIFLPMIGDANYHVGLPWARQGQFRLTYHPSDTWMLAASVENPQQYVASGAVIYPYAYNTALGPQFDAATNSATPNLHPDFVVKFSHDQKVGSRNWHLEGGGMMRSFRVAIPSGSTFTNHTVTGGGMTVGTLFELFKNCNFVGNVVWGNGTGRYLAALGPDAIVKPNGTPSLVHSGSVLAGFEWAASKTTTLAGYYGGTYSARNSWLDDTNPTPGKYIGFGGPGSANSANRAIQEATFAVTQTFWKSPNLGALQFISQGSYLTRAPWFVPVGAPKNAHVFMSTAGIRYVIP